MTDHQRGIEAATKAWMDDRGIDDRFDHWRGSMGVAISAYLSALAPQAGDNAEEPGGDDETESLLIRNLVGVVRKLCKHLPTTDMTRMEAEDFLLRNNLYGSVFRAHPCTSTPVVSQNAPDLEDRGGDVAAAMGWIDKHLSKTSMLPKPVDQMTETESSIFKIAAYHTGFLQFLRSTLEQRVLNLELPQDVIDLVIAAREAFDIGALPDDENRALDKALNPFSSRVPYENEPDVWP